MANEVEKLVVIHPEFGQVSFTGPTGRQADILTIYGKIMELTKQFPNDQELGEKVRKLLNKA